MGNPALPLRAPPRDAVPEFVGRYRVLRQLGQGGMGQVYLAATNGPAGFSRKVVLKRARTDQPGAIEEGLAQALIDEARLVAQLRHDNLVAVLALEEDAGAPVLVMEFIDGIDAATLLARSGAQPWPIAVQIVTELLSGLDHAHHAVDEAGRALAVVHRDVSPANILLSWDGAVKLTDFGAAQARRTDSISCAGLKGSVPYLAPEQARGKPLDPRADLFAVGVVLHELITGENPFRAGNDLATVARIAEAATPRLPAHLAPAPLRAIVERALAKQREHRYPNAAAFRDALLDLPALPRRHRRIRSLTATLAKLRSEVRSRRLSGGALLAVLGHPPDAETPTAITDELLRPSTRPVGRRRVDPILAALHALAPSLPTHNAALLAKAVVLSALVAVNLCLWPQFKLAEALSSAPTPAASPAAGPPVEAPRIAPAPVLAAAPPTEPAAPAITVATTAPRIGGGAPIPTGKAATPGTPATKINDPAPAAVAEAAAGPRCILDVRARPVARVFVDGAATGLPTPVRIDLPCGSSHRLALWRPGRAVWRRTLTLDRPVEHVLARLLRRAPRAR